MFAREFSCDIFLDVLKFLKRNEIEKCQLVSNNWNSIISIRPLTLPLWKFESIYFGQYPYIKSRLDQNWKIDINSSDSSPYLHAIKFRFFKAYYFENDGSIEVQRKLIQALGQKVQAQYRGVPQRSWI